MLPTLLFDVSDRTLLCWFAFTVGGHLCSQELARRTEAKREAKILAAVEKALEGMRPGR